MLFISNTEYKPAYNPYIAFRLTTKHYMFKTPFIRRCFQNCDHFVKDRPCQLIAHATSNEDRPNEWNHIGHKRFCVNRETSQI